MSIISDLVQKLRRMAFFDIGGVGKTLNQAADTIEELSAKVARQSMERSSQYYGGGWIPVEERLPEENEEYNDVVDPLTLAVVDTEWHIVSELVLVTVYDSNKDKTFVTDDCTVDGKWANYDDVLAWQPLPPAYEQKED